MQSLPTFQLPHEERAVCFRSVTDAGIALCFPRRSAAGKPVTEVELTVNAKGKGFLIQGQSGGGAGLATAASSSCRETI